MSLNINTSSSYHRQNNNQLYQNIQQNLKSTLQNQIHKMLPLKYDYADLQKYHLGISSQYQSLLKYHNSISHQNSQDLYQLLNLTEQLDIKRNQLLQQLKTLDNIKAEKILERKNYLSHCQALNQKYQLQKKQLLAQNQKGKQIIEETQILQRNIKKVRQNIQKIQKQTTEKEEQNQKVQENIKTAQLEKQKILSKKAKKQSKIQQVNAEHQINYKKVELLEKQLEDLLLQIQNSRKEQIQLNQMNIQRRKNIQKFKNQADYFKHLIQAQQSVLYQTLSSQKNFQAVVDQKKQQLESLVNSNKQIQAKIKQQQQKSKYNKQCIEASKEHLSQLIKLNRLLMQQLNKTCEQDLKVFKALQNKMKRNSILNDKYSHVLMRKDINQSKWSSGLIQRDFNCKDSVLTGYQDSGVFKSTLMNSINSNLKDKLKTTF